MKKLVLPILVATSMALSACASLKLTVQNDRSTAVKNVEVKAGSYRYVLPELLAGASDTRTLKADAEGSLGVNFVSAEGGLYYTASDVKLVKGKGHDLILRLDQKGNLITEKKK